MRPVNSLKHIRDIQGGTVATIQQSLEIATAVENAVSTTSKEVDQGSTISSIFLNVQAASVGTAALANFYIALCKNPGNNLTFPNANVLGSSDERKFVIHQEMIMSEKNTTAIPRTVFKGVIKIPRGYRRMGVKDRLVLLVFSPGVDFEFCVQSIYKEFR